MYAININNTFKDRRQTYTPFSSTSFQPRTNNNMFKEKPLHLEFPVLPSLTKVNASVETKETTCMYRTALEKEEEIDGSIQYYGLEEGQIRMIRDPVTRDIVVESNYVEKQKKNPTYHEYVSRIFDNLIQYWEKERRRRIEMNGDLDPVLHENDWSKQNQEDEDDEEYDYDMMENSDHEYC